MKALPRTRRGTKHDHYVDIRSSDALFAIVVKTNIFLNLIIFDPIWGITGLDHFSHILYHTSRDLRLLLPSQRIASKRLAHFLVTHTQQAVNVLNKRVPVD